MKTNITAQIDVLRQGKQVDFAACLALFPVLEQAKTSTWKNSFATACQRAQLDEALCWQQTDHADESEGLYIKVEESGQVVARYKWVRPGFVQTILDSGSHHSERPIVVNALREQVDIYAPEINKQWLQAACGGEQ